MCVYTQTNFSFERWILPRYSNFEGHIFFDYRTAKPPDNSMPFGRITFEMRWLTASRDSCKSGW
jgi:hypothetical protein